jgi:hypothetical protein
MHRRRPLILVAVVAAAAALSLLAAGCGGGGGSPSGVANVTTSTSAATTTTTQSGLLAFSQCMRSNGMPSFPDPQRFVGGNVKLTIHQFAPSQAAMNACDHLLPTNGGSGSEETAQQQRTQRADGLSFAACMRSHGVARFPDPTAQGELPVESVVAQGIDVHAPAFLQAVQTCLPASHGFLTPAKVAEALNKVGG